MTNQIETTLQDAVWHCKREGGRFSAKGCEDHDKWFKVTEDDRIETCGGKIALKPGVRAFEATWIYEPPQKSAFQEWNQKQDFKNFKQVPVYRKEGWNGLADRIISDSQICLTPSEVEKVKNLKEP